MLLISFFSIDTTSGLKAVSILSDVDVEFSLVTLLHHALRCLPLVDGRLYSILLIPGTWFCKPSYFVTFIDPASAV
jgi:hypothetical protein